MKRALALNFSTTPAQEPPQQPTEKDFAMQTANLCSEEIYEDEFAHCQRSPEYKAGALSALRLRAGLQHSSDPWGDIDRLHSPSPYAAGTAADDAFEAGHLAGLIAWSFAMERAGLGE